MSFYCDHVQQPKPCLPADLTLPRSARSALRQFFLHQPLQVFPHQRLVLGLFLGLQFQDPSFLFGRDDLVLCEIDRHAEMVSGPTLHT